MTNEWEELALDWEAARWDTMKTLEFLRGLEDLERDMTDAYTAYERLMNVREKAGEVLSANDELRLEYFKRLTERMKNDEQGSNQEA